MSTFRTESGGALCYGTKYLVHPDLFPGYDIKGALVELVRGGVKDEAQVATAARLMAMAYTIGHASGKIEASYGG